MVFEQELEEITKKKLIRYLKSVTYRGKVTAIMVTVLEELETKMNYRFFAGIRYTGTVLALIPS